MPPDHPAGDSATVDPDASIAESLPRVYRAVLDAVGRLERLGMSHEALECRRRAIAVYSRTWNRKSQRKLEAILARADGAAVEHERRAALRIA